MADDLLPFRGSASELSRAVLDSHQRLLRDVYVDAEVDLDLAIRCRATLVAVPDAVFDRVVLTDEHGGWIGEADLGDERAKVAIQYDGSVHFEGRDEDSARVHGQHDVDRDELARLAGWEVVVLTARDLANPELMTAKVRAAYARAADRARGRLAA